LLEELGLPCRLSSAYLAGAEFTCADIMVMFRWPAYLKAMSIAGPSATPGDRNEP
jgi:glutathione S-transferase